MESDYRGPMAEERHNVRRRLIPLLVAGLVLLAGFTAAAVASGGSPLGLLREKRATPAAHQRHAKVVAPRGNAAPARPKDASADSDSAQKPDRDEAQGATEQRSGSTEARVEHKVTVCHHTGSWKHPFHATTVDENAVTAHRDHHGDTIGPCPAATTHVAPSANPAKEKPAKHRSHPGNGGRGESDEHGRGHDNGGRSNGGGDGRSQSR